MDPDPSSLLLIFLEINTSFLVSFVLLFILLLCSALISGAEVALFSLKKGDIETADADSSKSIILITSLLERPKKLLATILVANNFINIAIVILFAYIGKFLFSSIENEVFRFLLEVICATFLILLFGEIIPKIYASRNSLKFSIAIARPLRFLDVVFSPISIPLQFITIQIQNGLGKQKSNISVDQLSQALELTNDDDTTKEEQQILQSIVSFGNTDTKQVMRPRMDIFAVNIDAEFNTIIPEIINNGYSRIPVFEENIDKVVGILYVKDLLPHLNKKIFDWKTILREPFFVPENKKLDDLMQEFQIKKVHLAIVVDEYGGTSGVISLEDIIEEIVGDISDEYDVDDLNFSKIDENNYRFDGKTSLKDIYKILSIEDNSLFEDKKGEAETIAGFILELSGGFPRVGIEINFGNYVFTIEAIDKKRIKQIRLTIVNH
ncbi:gliding motility-associated protein GldE [uncultured Winogradskyella sp.]|uniref:gliding motility-associated protein GldE n=1 Tax=uncultured Winogradskyella sp. TaxID=395353 RepID=UPI0025E4A81E|nr:gliding motility-associated protein GldE [uncultured Winogradskyella sp.]